ncbi:MAG: protein-disulfide reductase DsbD domain-containing protein [Bauldia sp.]
MAALALAIVAQPAAAAVGQWVVGAKAEVRLLAAGIGGDGRLSAGIEITLPPGWKTYWRSPGDAGIAPTIDFSASRNLGPVEVSFPVPQRFDDGFSITNAYEGRVVLPISAAVRDKSSPVDLVLSLDLGVCEEVCIPDHIDARLAVPAGDSDAAAAALVADARARLPGAPEPGVFFVAAASRDGGTDKRPMFRFKLAAPDAANAVVFAEGPEDWYADVPVLAGTDGDRADFTVKFDRLVAKTPIAGARFRLTIVSGGRAIEQTIGLD